MWLERERERTGALRAAVSTTTVAASQISARVSTPDRQLDESIRRNFLLDFELCFLAMGPEAKPLPQRTACLQPPPITRRSTSDLGESECRGEKSLLENTPLHVLQRPSKTIEARKRWACAWGLLGDGNVPRVGRAVHTYLYVNCA